MSIEINKRVGEKIKKRIELKYGDIKQFCMVNDINVDKVYRLTRGEGNPTVSTLTELANALGVKPEYFFKKG